MKYIRCFFLFGFVLAFLVGNLFKPNLFLSEIHPGILDLFVALALLYLVLFHRRKLLASLKVYENILEPVIIFLILGAFSLFISFFSFLPVQVIVGSLYLFRFASYLSLIITLPLLFPSFWEKWLVRLVMLAAVSTSLFQYLIFPDVRSLQVSEWDPHYFRVVGSFLDPGFTSILLCFVLFRLWFRPEFKQVWINRVIWGIVYVLFALTYSRSGYLAFLGGWGYLAFQTRSPKRFIFPALLIILTVFLLPRSPGGEGVKLERTSSVQARLINWGHSVRIFLDHPVLGTGFNTYRYAQKQYGYLDSSDWLRSHAGAGADSSLLFVAATTGLLGLGAYLFWLKRLWVFSGKDLLFHTYFTALIVHSLFLNSLFYPFVLFWLFINLPKTKLQPGV